MGEKKPNVLVFFTDQQRWDTVGVYGSPMNLTPNLDALAREGTKFDLAFTNQPVCAPARACIFTGQYATTHKVWRNGFGLKAEDNTLAHCFKKAGYEVGYIGKWHLSPDELGPGYVPPEYRGGFEDYWEAANLLEFTSHPYDTNLYDRDGNLIHISGYRVDALTERVIKFINQSHSNPFFLVVSYLEPHHQNDLNRFVAPDGYREKFSNPFVPYDLRTFPGDWQEQLPDYYGCIARLDEDFGSIVDTLKEKGMFEDTIVVFLSDHGCHFRTRNTEYKRSCHESSIRVPLIFHGPGFNKSLVIPEPVSLINFAPTILDAVNIPVPDTMQGRSAMPLLDRKIKDWKNEIFIQISESCVARAIRTERWKYSVIAEDKDGWLDSNSDTYTDYQLYDLYSDPYELVNLAGRREYKGIIEELRERLTAKIEEVEGVKPGILERRFYP
ncbi:MAG TPA: sulfatase-like hydrolase/transferase [bacterium]|nr:sulfatase-like hydrolase/transferase [bacterium]